MFLEAGALILKREREAVSLNSFSAMGVKWHIWLRSHLFIIHFEIIFSIGVSLDCSLELYFISESPTLSGTYLFTSRPRPCPRPRPSRVKMELHAAALHCAAHVLLSFLFPCCLHDEITFSH